MTFSWTIVILILCLSNLENVKVSIKVTNFDKVAHFLLYFIYAIFIALSFKNLKQKKVKFYFFTFLYLIIFGFLIEFLQGNLTTYRSQDMKDEIANSVGAIFGLFLVFILVRKTRNYKI